MTQNDILRLRLKNQQITSTKFTHPHELINYLGAMQSQEYNMAKWAIRLRLPKISEAGIENEFNAGKILRTHVLRPTWHFVSPENIRWLIALTAPHVQKQNEYMGRKLEITPAMLRRSADVITKSLENRNHLTREEINQMLNKHNFQAEGLRAIYLVMNAELEGLICSGGRKGKQFTYALMNEQVPTQKPLQEDEALSRIANLFFRSRGPATVQDLAYWSGLSVTKSARATSMLSADFTSQNVDGRKYHFIQEAIGAEWSAKSTFLMPDYDEYGMSYKDKTALLGKLEKLPVLSGPLLSHMLVADGRFAGSWRRKVDGKKLTISVEPFKKISTVQNGRVRKAVNDYTAFFSSSGSITSVEFL